MHVPRLLLQRQIIKHKEKRYKKNNVRQNLLNRYKIKKTLKKTASYSSIIVINDFVILDLYFFGTEPNYNKL